MNRSMRRLVVAAAWVVLASTLASCKPVPGCDPPDGPSFSVQLAQGAPSCEPPPPCEGCGGGSGDPHLQTFDGQRYNLQTAAEVVATRTHDRSFEVQWRQEPYGTTRTAGITAVAMRIGGSRISIVGAGPVITVDGDTVSLGKDETLALPTGVTIYRSDGRQVIVSHDPSVASVHVQLNDRAMGVLIDPPEAERGELEGLLGDADGDPDNDVVLSDGAILEEVSWDAVHPELAEAWRVVDDTTLFDYDDGAGPDTYWDPTFPAELVRLGDFSDEERARAEAVCREAGVSEEGLLDSCIFDVLVTGDDAMVELFARQQLAAGIELSAAGGGGEGAEPVEVDEGSVAWATLMPGTTSAQSALIADDQVLVQVQDRQRQTGLLKALSLGDGSVVWELPGVDRHSPVAAAGGRLIVLSQANGPLSDEDGRPVLLAVETDTGDIIDGLSFVADRDADERPLDRPGQVVAVDGALVHVGRSWMSGFDPDDLSLRWQVEMPGRIFAGPHVASGVAEDTLVWAGWRVDDEFEVALVDTTDGRVVASTRLPGREVSDTSSVAVDGGLVLTTTAEDSEQLVRVDVDARGDELGLVVGWSTELAEGERAPRRLAVAGDTVVGYTTNTVVSAFALSDGEHRWDAEATSFNNNDRRLAGDDSGAVVIGSFGGAYLEAFDGDGSLRWRLEPDDVATSGNPGSVVLVGPSSGDRVVAVSQSSDGVLVVAVPIDRR